MKYDFDKWASHIDNGNMKGSWAQDMPRGGVMLSGAEMDYPLPEFITQAIADFAKNGLYGFTLPDKDYKASICSWMKLTRNRDANPDHIVATLGTTFGLSTAIRAFTDENDGVIIQHPSYGRFDRAITRNRLGSRIHLHKKSLRKARYFNRCIRIKNTTRRRHGSHL